MNIKCIAEGVETVEQGEILLSLGCKYAQGYLIAKPMSELDIPQWIRTWEVPTEWQKKIDF